MTDLIKNKISEAYSIVGSKFDSIHSFEKIFFFDIPDHLTKYHNFWGAEPNREYLLLLFLSKFAIEDLELTEDSPYFSPYLRLSDYNFIKSNKGSKPIFNLTVPEALELICPYNVVGSDGCGGTFFFNPTDSNNSLYHSYEEFEVIGEIKSSIEKISQKYLVKELLDMFEVYKKSEFVRIRNYEGIENKNTEKLAQMDDELNLSLAIVGCSGFLERVDYQYSHQEFVEYFSLQSIYWKSNEITTDINSRLAFAMFFLFLSEEFSKLKALIELSKNVKGEVYGNLREGFLKEII